MFVIYGSEGQRRAKYIVHYGKRTTAISGKSRRKGVSLVKAMYLGWDIELWVVETGFYEDGTYASTRQRRVR